MPRPETVTLWRERLRRFASSRVTVAQFCLSEGVSQASLYRWRKLLRELSGDAEPESPATSLQFLPLRMDAQRDVQLDPSVDQQASPSLASPSLASPSLASTTVELPGGVRIRVEVPVERQPSAQMADLA